MGTYLKLASQNTNVAFLEVSSSAVSSTEITASNAFFVAASGSFSGSFTGDFSGGVTTTTPLIISASKGYLSYVDSGVFTLVSTGSVSHIFLIQDATGSALKVNGEGVTEFKVFSGSAPTPVSGGIYFTSTDMYIGI
jgi:hypothetical protein